MAEVVLGVIPDARVSLGLFKSETWALVVTDRRLLGARVADELKNRVAGQARAQAKASGSGFLGQLRAQIDADVALGQHYGSMTPEEILAETPGNWALSPGQVSSIKVERKSRGGGEDGPDIDYLKITIGTPAGQGTYRTSDDRPNQHQVQALLAGVFGPIVR